jgi:curli biogenesis system outer membrane secretion channel CsgG
MRRQMKTTGLLLWLLTACGSADAADVFPRWAILSAPEVASSGLSDLLTAELSQRKFELVEREQLAAITKEIELSRLLGPAGGGIAAARRLRRNLQIHVPQQL